jgi:hypothetical protein
LIFESDSRMAMASANTVFPLRGLRPLVCKRDFEEANSADTPAPTNRIAASPSGFKSVRRREHPNVIRNSRKIIKPITIIVPSNV